MWNHIQNYRWLCILERGLLQNLIWESFIKFETPWFWLVCPEKVPQTTLKPANQSGCSCFHLCLFRDDGKQSVSDNEKMRGSSGPVLVCERISPRECLSSKLTGRPAEVALHGPGQNPADCLECRGSTLVLKHSLSLACVLTHAFAHTRSARGENPAPSARRKQR